MFKISDKLVNDYIAGNDIKEATLEELEDNKLFMEKVIEKTNDKNIYNLCSEQVKTNPGFVRFLIKKFTSDVDFLDKVATYFIKNSKGSPSNYEISIIMRALTKKYDHDSYETYDFYADTFYTFKRMKMEFFKGLCKDDYELVNDIGLGFWFIFDEYHGNEIVCNYTAKKMLKELFIDDYYALERILHEQYNSVLEIEEKGYKNCIIDIIRIYDDMLSSYICVHTNLLNSFLPKLNSILKRWDKYVNKSEIIMYHSMYERVHDYMRDSEDNTLSEIDLISYIGNEMKISDKLIKYNIVSYDMDDDDRKEIATILMESFVDKVNYKNVKEIMFDSLFNHNELLYLFNEEDKEQDEKANEGKIIYLADALKKTKKI